MPDAVKVELALRSLIGSLDYDLYKSWVCNEETGEDDFPIMANMFMKFYNAG